MAGTSPAMTRLLVNVFAETLAPVYFINSAASAA
jgi:hypothetical protein